MSFEQHSADNTWRIQGGRKRWVVIVRSVPIATMLKREWARELIRSLKKFR